MDSFEQKSARRAPSIVLVGNGGSLKGCGKGSVIDDHDYVLRFNNFVTEGFESDVGGRFTHWATCLDKSVKAREVKGLKEVLLTVNEAMNQAWWERWRTMLEWKERKGVNVVKPAWMQISKNQGLISSGLTAVKHYLLEFRQVSLVGFDSFRIEHVHHYWEPEVIRSKDCPHNRDEEINELRNLTDAGRIVWL